MENGKFSYYENAAIMYHEATEEQRKQSRDYWLRIHAENVKSKREDMIMFSARRLADMDMIDGGRFAELFA